MPTEIYEDTPFFPAAVALEVTLRCDMRCMHCGSSADGRPRPNELTIDQWKGVVDQLVNLGSEYMTLSGGEPFVWPHWRALSKHIRNKNRVLSIISNGYKITDNDIKYLADIGMWNVGLSVDGMMDTHDEIRRTPGSFNKVMDVIGRFKKTPVKVAVSTSVNKINFKELKSLRQCLADRGVDLWQVQVVNSFGRAGELRERLIIDPEQYTELVNFIFDSQQIFKRGRLKMNVMPADSIGYCHGIAADIWGDMEWRGCNAGRYVLGIESNGDVVGCLSLQRDLFVAGNILRQNIADIWNNDEAFAYNRKFNPGGLKGGCANCSEGNVCRSGCLAMGYSTSGELYNNPYCYKYIMEKSHTCSKVIMNGCQPPKNM